MLRKGLGVFLFIAVIGIIFHTSDAFAETQQFTVDPFKAVNLGLHLDKGDELQWTLVVSGEEKNNIFFYIDTPSGAVQYSAFCSAQYSAFESSSKCNEGGSFIAAESGTYQFLFDNGVGETIPTTFTGSIG